MQTNWDLIDFSRVEVVSFDLGYTILGPNAWQIARLIHKHFKISVTPAAILEADLKMRHDYMFNKDANATIQTTHFSEVICGLLDYMFPLFREVAARPKALSFFKDACRRYNDEHNFFDQIYPDALPALKALHRAQIRMIVISNAHGTLDRDLQKYGLHKYFEHILDSGVELIAKPDSEIFTRAADRCAVKIENILHIGDNPTADIQGALKAGMQAALYDPIGMFPHADGKAPQYRNHMEVVEQILSAREDRLSTNTN